MHWHLIVHSSPETEWEIRLACHFFCYSFCILPRRAFRFTDWYEYSYSCIIFFWLFRRWIFPCEAYMYVLQSYLRIIRIIQKKSRNNILDIKIPWLWMKISQVVSEILIRQLLVPDCSFFTRNGNWKCDSCHFFWYSFCVLYTFVDVSSFVEFTGISRIWRHEHVTSFFAACD